MKMMRKNNNNWGTCFTMVPVESSSSATMGIAGVNELITKTVSWKLLGGADWRVRWLTRHESAKRNHPKDKSFLPWGKSTIHRFMLSHIAVLVRVEKRGFFRSHGGCGYTGIFLWTTGRKASLSKTSCLNFFFLIYDFVMQDPVHFSK